MQAKQNHQKASKANGIPRTPVRTPDGQTGNLAWGVDDALTLDRLARQPDYSPDPTANQVALMRLGQKVGNQSIQRLLIQRETKGEEEKKFKESVSTPIPKGAKIEGGKATLTVGGAKVTILPDEDTDDESLKDKAKTTTGLVGWGTPGYEFEEKDGEEIITKVEAPEPPEVEIKTIYGPGTKKGDPSKYGRGTTEADVKAKKTTLGHHEGMHGKSTLDYLKNNPLPKFKGKKGMTKADFEKAMADYDTEMEEYSAKMAASNKEEIDCVGKKAGFCAEEEHEH